MKYLKKFNESESKDSKLEISFEEAKEWILQNYSEDKVIEMFDEEVSSGNWVDSEQMEDEGYESEHDWYTDYGRGEAESAVQEEIIRDLKNNFSLSFNIIGGDTDIYDWLEESYDILKN